MKISPFNLRSTLYMPATQKGLTEIINNQYKTNADAIVFCFEDALNLADIPKGIDNLNETFKQLNFDPVTGQIIGRGKLPYRFIRVRSLENFYQLMTALNEIVIRHIHGIVISKFTPSDIHTWENALFGRDFVIMPTLETEDYYDPNMIQALFSRLKNSELAEKTAVVRVGGNDLLRGLLMKRPRYEQIADYAINEIATLYDTPIAFLINQMMIQARYHGFELTAPVFEYFADENQKAFIAEVIKDRTQGFVGKTAIHPSQCEILNELFTISEDDKRLARQIVAGVESVGLNGGVYNNQNSMVEPTTHYAWANRLIRGEIE